LSKKKKQKKKKPQDTLLLSSEEETRLGVLLDNLADLDPSSLKAQIQSPQLAQALVEKLPGGDPSTPALLSAISEAFEQKNVQKAIKRTRFRLKKRGFAIPESDTEANRSILAVRAEHVEPTACLGPIDGRGYRVVFVALPHAPKGFDIGMGVVNDEKGFSDFFSGRYSKKKMKEIQDLFFENVAHVIETSLSHAATVMEAAYGLEGGGEPKSSNAYLDLRPSVLEKVTLLEKPVIYDFIPAGSVSKEDLTGSRIRKLLEHQLMETWIADPEEVKPLFEEIVEAEGSPIYISDEQKATRINEIKESGIPNLYPESKRPLLKFRLEEMAYFFFKLDQEEYARLSLAAALSLEEKDSSLMVNPFLKALMEQSLDFYFKAAGEMKRSEDPQEDSSPKIIIP